MSPPRPYIIADTAWSDGARRPFYLYVNPTGTQSTTNGLLLVSYILWTEILLDMELSIEIELHVRGEAVCPNVVLMYEGNRGVRLILMHLGLLW